MTSSSSESEYQILERSYPGLSRIELRNVLNERRNGTLIRQTRPILRRNARSTFSNSGNEEEESSTVDEFNSEVKRMFFGVIFASNC